MPGSYRLAKHIHVGRDEGGAPCIEIDGERLPWMTCGIVTLASSLQEMPTVTITIPAERVTMTNDDIMLMPRGAPMGEPVKSGDDVLIEPGGDIAVKRGVIDTVTLVEPEPDTPR